MRTRILTLVLLVTPAGSLAAQAWDAPSFLAPDPGEDLGVYFVQPEDFDWGLVGIWRQEGALNLGVRAGAAQPEGDGDTRIIAGAETYGRLLSAGPDFPLDAAWALGFGASFGGDVTFARIPVGVTVGREFVGGGLTLQPYAYPRLALDIVAVDGGDTETDLSFVGDIGVDVGLGGSLVFRVGTSFEEDRSAFGLGVAYRMPREVAVR